jgi:hypothetical protein
MLEQFYHFLSPLHVVDEAQGTMESSYSAQKRVSKLLELVEGVEFQSFRMDMIIMGEYGGCSAL